MICQVCGVWEKGDHDGDFCAWCEGQNLDLKPPPAAPVVEAPVVEDHAALLLVEADEGLGGLDAAEENVSSEEEAPPIDVAEGLDGSEEETSGESS